MTAVGARKDATSTDLRRRLGVPTERFDNPSSSPMWTLLGYLRDWWRTRRTRRITPDNARERVRRGAAYLDDMDPGWHRRVDPDTLSLDSGEHCVLGQLHGEFRRGLGRSRLLNLSSGPQASLSPVAYGFRCTQNVPGAWQERDYELLTAAWRDAVRRRRVSEDLSGDGHAGGAEPVLASTTDPSTA